jgi:hypothetical protein
VKSAKADRFSSREHPEALPRHRYEAADKAATLPQEAREVRAARRDRAGASGCCDWVVFQF